jgi:beta-glucosidase-like glycosyl hydrolase/serine/threonine protein kinase
MRLTSGQTFAGYTIIRLLGSGGMGEVYLAQHPRLPRRDALKLLPREWSGDEEFRARFNREADLASTLWHPHIVGVHDRGEEEGQLWISMDFVDGLDTAQLLADRYPAGMPVEEVVRIVTAVASALDYAHKRQLLHRDIKPANIMMTHLGDEGEHRVLLTDFGIARNVDDISGLTKTNFTVGTVAYSAPEQLLGEDASGRADQYSLAATAYHLLTGLQLFPHTNPAVVISRHLNVSPPALADSRPELANLDPVLAIGLAKRPEGRFQRCSEFASALAEQINSAGARTQAAPTRLAPVTNAAPEVGAAGSHEHSKDDKPARARVIALCATLFAVMLVAALIFTWRPWQRHDGRSSSESFASTSPSSAPIAAGAPPVCADDPTALTSALPIRDKLAQLLMVGVKNADDARAAVNSYHVGGILIGSWTDLSIFNGPLADMAVKAAPLPLAVSVDEEGGRVSRLKALIGTSPSPRQLARTQTVQQVRDLAADRGKKMRDLGITVDFAPVADVTDSPDGSVIGDRSFSNDPNTVTAYAGAYAQGLRDAGLLPVLKHFPGYGHGSGDSHTGDVITPPLRELQNVDLVPYRTLVTFAPVAVMVGHLEVPGLTGDTPASLSPVAVQLLRDGTGYGAPPFNGPVFSDDLSNAAAISDRYGVSEAVLRALLAGVDVALWITTDEVPAALDRLQKAVASGELPVQRVNESLVRVATMKGPSRACGH